MCAGLAIVTDPLPLTVVSSYHHERTAVFQRVRTTFDLKNAKFKTFLLDSDVALPDWSTPDMRTRISHTHMHI